MRDPGRDANCCEWRDALDLVRSVRTHVASLHDREDALQEACVSVLQASAKGEPTRPTTALLAVLMRRRLVDGYRRQRRAAAVTGLDLTQVGAPELPGGGGTDWCQVIEAAGHEIPRAWRPILGAFAAGVRTNTALARLLHRSAGSIRRSRRRLMRWLESGLGRPAGPAPPVPPDAIGGCRGARCCPGEMHA